MTQLGKNSFLLLIALGHSTRGEGSSTSFLRRRHGAIVTPGGRVGERLLHSFGHKNKHYVSRQNDVQYRAKEVIDFVSVLSEGIERDFNEEGSFPPPETPVSSLKQSIVTTISTSTAHLIDKTNSATTIQPIITTNSTTTIPPSDNTKSSKTVSTPEAEASETVQTSDATNSTAPVETKAPEEVTKTQASEAVQPTVITTSKKTPTPRFDISDCQSYESKWIVDLQNTCRDVSTLEGCECTQARGFIESGELVCAEEVGTSPPACPNDCIVCKQCVVLSGCPNIYSITIGNGLAWRYDANRKFP